MSYLEQSEIHRHLDSQFKILGFNAQDLLLVLLIASINNLIFGQTPLNLIMVFIVPAVLALLLILGKRNKPDDFLKHYLRYQSQSGFFSAAQQSKHIHQRNKHVITK
ncbi:hypothetical protein MRY82_07095 [bacterium]|nr:hypothetical protein [bacterium]